MRKIFLLSLFVAVASLLPAQSVFKQLEGSNIADSDFNGYSSDGRYIVGNMPSAQAGGEAKGFLYDTATDEITTIEFPKNDVMTEGTVNAVTLDGSIIVGAYRNMDLTVNNAGTQTPIMIAAYHKNGQWYSLGLGEDNSLFTDYLHGSYATHVSNDGKVIAGYVKYTDTQIPCAWIQNEAGQYVYTPYELPNDKAANYGLIQSISGDGSIATGIYMINDEIMEDTTCPVIWTSPTTPEGVSFFYDFGLYLSRTTSFLMSNSGEYGVLTISLVSINEETYEFELIDNVYFYTYSEWGGYFDQFRFGENASIATGISDNGTVVGYDQNIIDLTGGVSTSKPYIYFKESTTILNLHTYLQRYAYDLIDDITGIGFNPEDEYQARLLNVSSDGKTLIGKNKGATNGTFESAFYLKIENESTEKVLTFNKMVGEITKTTTNSIFTLVATSGNPMTVEENQATFENGVTYNTRLKLNSASKTDSRYIIINCPAPGKIKIGVRNSSKTEVRKLVATLYGEEIFSQDIPVDEEKDVYSIIEIPMNFAAEVTLTATGALNFYFLEYEDPNYARMTYNLSTVSEDIIHYSRNGKYLVGLDPDLYQNFLFDVETRTKTILPDTEEGSFTPYAVTSDGSIIVGKCPNPAYVAPGVFFDTTLETAGYYKDGSWHFLPLPAEYAPSTEGDNCIAVAISEDGNTIVGNMYLNNSYIPVSWTYNSATSAYDFVLYQVPEVEDNGDDEDDNGDDDDEEVEIPVQEPKFNQTRIIGVSADGSLVFGVTTSKEYTNHLALWRSSDNLEIREEAITSFPVSISNNGKYIALGEEGVYYVETGEIQTIDPVQGLYSTHNMSALAVSDNGVVVGNISYYDNLIMGMLYVPYIHILGTETTLSSTSDLYSYVYDRLPNPEVTLPGLGFREYEVANARLAGISADGNTFIGVDRMEKGQWFGYNYTELFALIVDRGPDYDEPATPVTVNPLTADYRVAGYSSDLGYLVGEKDGYAFKYNVRTSKLTQLTTANTANAVGITTNGEIVITNINYSNSRSTAVVIRDGKFITLPNGEDIASSTVAAISNRGEVIVGSAQTSDYTTLPAKWTYNSTSGEYTYSTYSLPEGANGAEAKSVSSDGNTVAGTYNSDKGTLPIIWSGNSYTTLFTDTDLAEIEFMETTTPKLSNNGKYMTVNIMQLVSGAQDVERLAGIYDLGTKTLELMEFLTNEDIQGNENFLQIDGSEFYAISNDKIAFGQVLIQGKELPEPFPHNPTYYKPFVYHTKLGGAVSLYEYIEKNDKESLDTYAGYELGLNTIGGSQAIAIDAIGEEFLILGNDPEKYEFLHIEYTYDPSSIDSESVRNISVYPNPATDYIGINGEFVKATLFSVEGNVVLSTSANSIGVSSLSAGTYFLQIETVNGTLTQKVIIRK